MKIRFWILLCVICYSAVIYSQTSVSDLCATPNVPDVIVDTLHIDNSGVYNAKVRYFSAGCDDGYSVLCEGLQDDYYEQRTIKDELSTMFENLSVASTYRFRVYANNAHGASSNVKYLYGTQNGHNFTILPQVYNNKALHYTVMYNNQVIEVPLLELSILDTSGNVMMTLDPSQNDIDITSLKRGYYILNTVLETGQIINVLFLRR